MAKKDGVKHSLICNPEPSGMLRELHCSPAYVQSFAEIYCFVSLILEQFFILVMVNHCGLLLPQLPVPALLVGNTSLYQHHAAETLLARFQNLLA